MIQLNANLSVLSILYQTIHQERLLAHNIGKALICHKILKRYGNYSKTDDAN